METNRNANDNAAAPVAGANDDLTIIRIEAIWDLDHGKENQGWYIRVSHANGERADIVPPSGLEVRRNASQSDIRRLVLSALSWEGLPTPSPLVYEVDR